MKFLLLTLIAVTSLSVKADTVIETGLFDQAAENFAFESASQLEEHIKTNMPSTYLYFERLNAMAKKRVFQHHQENTDKDITEIVLVEYRNRS